MEDAKEEIRARLPVEDVVGQYIELKRAGANFKGHSPWGTDRTPSFMVSPEKGIWHDFSSNKGGDIFSFVMEMEGIGFREALEKLARQAGVELRRYSDDDRKQAERKKRVYEALELATHYFQMCLVRNKEVCEYVFYKRNLNKKTVEKFRIGYAPETGDALVKALTKRGYTREELDAAGLLNRFGKDLFCGRMMIPLMDDGGRVVGFTGRIIKAVENAPKYLNTPETILYNKGRHVFGFSQAKEFIRRSDFVVVVEGNMDVISSHQAGVCEAVATAGTAMTENHLKSFARMTNDIRLAYDGDEAGVRAAERAITLASKFEIYLSVVDDYAGCKDADELIQKDPELWKASVRKARPALEWLLEKYEERYDLRSEKGFREYCKQSKLMIELIGEGNAALKEKYERSVSERLGISLEAFRAEKVEKPEMKKRLKKPNLKEGVNTDEVSRAEKNLLAIVKVGGVVLEDVELSEAAISQGELELIFEQKYSARSSTELMAEARALVAIIEKERLTERKRAIEQAIREAEAAGDEERENALMAELNAILRK